MPVGAGSIKRAAKMNAGAAETKTTAKKTAAKKSAETKTAAAQESTGNQVCHLTEELPIYLL